MPRACTPSTRSDFHLPMEISIHGPCTQGKRPLSSAGVCLHAHEPVAATSPYVQSPVFLGPREGKFPPSRCWGPRCLVAASRLPPPPRLFSLDPHPASRSKHIPQQAPPRNSATPSIPAFLPGHGGRTHFCASRERPGHASPAGPGQLRRRKRRPGPQLLEQRPQGPHAPQATSVEGKEKGQAAALPRSRTSPGDNVGPKATSTTHTCTLDAF